MSISSSTSSGDSIACKRPRTAAASNTFVPSPISRMAGHTTEVAKYLSQEWLDDLDRAAEATDLVRAVAPDLVFVVEHEVTEAPEGDRPLSHRVRSGDGAAARGPGGEC